MDIEKYARRRGVKVSWVRIWPSKRDPDCVVVRLNVEDNQNALHLEKPFILATWCGMQTLG